MYTYEKLWEILKKRGITKYALRTYHGISKTTLDRLRNNGNVRVDTLDRLCDILNCSFNDILTYIPTEDTPCEEDSEREYSSANDLTKK